jgi:hypothetical protein
MRNCIHKLRLFLARMLARVSEWMTPPKRNGCNGA